jgi:hypothetical protein
MLYYHDTNLAGKGVMKAKIVSKFLGTTEVRNLKSTELRKRIGIVNRHCFIPRGKMISFETGRSPNIEIFF